jgi:hypothetical protein
MAKPTASASGTKRLRAAPGITNAGMNTARTTSIASRRGTAVSLLPSLTAKATLEVCRSCVWMFSTSTVDSSTRMPTASARPPSVIRLMVCPVAHSATSAPSSASGMFSTTTTTERQSRKNNSTMSPTSPAARAPSKATFFTALMT